MEQLPDYPLEVPVKRFSSRFTLLLYRESARLGEWTEHQVRELYAEGLLLPSDFFWREGLKEWHTLQRLFQSRSSPSIFSSKFCERSGPART